ncbi:MAG: hypothetical protein ACM3PY_12435, partial [Omnitrophica WOR_2 bacterium]
MKTIQYSGEIWNGPSIHPELWNLLQQKDLLVELACGQPPFQVILGVPHHAGVGVDRIAEDWYNPRLKGVGRPADATTGLAGLVLFSALREMGTPCKLAIAAHPTDHDPNKTPGCPYWQSVFTSLPAGNPGTAPHLPPTLLLELHGANSQRRHALELSAGQNEVANTLRFGRLFAYYLNGDWIYAIQEKAGSKQARVYKQHTSTAGKLQNPALETLSLAHAGQLGIPALHLEMKAIFRRPDPDFPGEVRPTPAAWELARALVSTLQQINQPDDIHISAANF